MTSDEFLNANSCYIQLEVYDMDIFKNIMDDLKINYLPDDNSKNNVFFNFALSDLVVRLNDYGCTVRKCFNVENDLKEFS